MSKQGDSAAHFEIAYDGPALEDHSINVRTLGPALIAVGDLCYAVNRSITGDNDHRNLEVRVKSTKAGSFVIGLEVLQRLPILAEAITASAILLTLKGFLRFLKAKKGRPIKTSRNREGSTIVVVGDGNEITVSQDVYRVFADPSARSAARDLVGPLGGDTGINKFALAESGEAKTEVTFDEVEAGYFDVIPGGSGVGRPAHPTANH